MSAALVIAEHDGAGLSPATGSTVTAASLLGVGRVDVAVVGNETEAVASEASRLSPAAQVLRVEHPASWPYLAATWAPQIAALAADYSHVLAPATTFGKDLLPRVAAGLNVGMLSDVTVVESAHQFLRPVYAGNALVRVAADPDAKLCATIRPAAFERAKMNGTADIRLVQPEVELPTHTKFVEHRPSLRQGPDLETAARVVAGGRGVGSEQNFALIDDLANALNAAVGASRAAVDSGWASNDMQVGQTGKIIAPTLYIAVGISGAIQHLTGIRDAGTVVAINQDADAPICAAADLVLVGDLFTHVPELIGKLRSRGT